MKKSFCTVRHRSVLPTPDKTLRPDQPTNPLNAGEKNRPFGNANTDIHTLFAR
jgi:hypothetical protein